MMRNIYIQVDGPERRKIGEIDEMDNGTLTLRFDEMPVSGRCYALAPEEPADPEEAPEVDSISGKTRKQLREEAKDQTGAPPELDALINGPFRS